MKTKLSRAILLASVSLLSVIGATMAFSSNSSSDSSLLSQNVEVLTQGESGNDGAYCGGILQPAVIVCTSGETGPCTKRVEYYDMGWWVYVTKCGWTGRSSDECYLGWQYK